MADRYIENQRKIIRKKMMSFLPAYICALFCILVVMAAIISVKPPHPQSWKTDEVVFESAQYRNKKRTLARYASSGYEIVDRDGNLYWAGKELTWQEFGVPYTIKYYTQEAYRKLTFVSHGDKTIISEEEQIRQWKQTTEELSIILVVCTVALIWVLWSLYKACNQQEIKECRERIRMQEAKAYRRKLDKYRE